MIRPTFLAFETAKKALSASQAGLDTVGHNISNVSTAGYTRQRIDQVSVGMGGSAMKYQVYGKSSSGAGQGVNVNAITQIRDPYLDNRYRAEAANNGELGVKHDGLTDINNIFDEIQTDGLHFKFGQLINDLTVLANTADSPDLAAIVRNRASELAQMLNKNASQLEEARAQTQLDFTITVEQDVNSILEKIASLNGKIKEDNLHGSPSNELNDERNLLLDQLSEFMDIRVVRTPVTVGDVTIESLSVELKDSGDPPIKLIDSSICCQLKVSQDEATGNAQVTLLDRVSGAGEIDLNKKLCKGAIKGYIDILNGNGPNAAVGENSFRGMPYYQKSLDEYAQMLAEVFNRVNNVTEQESLDSGGSISATTDKNLFVPDQPTIKGTKPEWIDTIVAGSLQFSGKDYDINFTSSPTADRPDRILAEINGKTYAADYPAGGSGKMDFYEIDNNATLEPSGDPNPDYGKAIGERAFSVNTTAKAYNNASITLDAKISARNIAVASSWFEDPLYITTSKQKPITDAQPVLKLSGGSNPIWIDSIRSGSDGIKVPDGSYVIAHDKTATPPSISVKIDGITYTGEYKANQEIVLKGGTDDKVGLIIKTNHRMISDYDSGNTITVKNSTGANADNLNKFSTEIRDSNKYLVSGFSGSFQEFLVDFQQNMAGDKDLNTSKLEGSSTVITAYADRRDSVSAVSIDEEGINMMTYTNHYNAAARYMTALDEAVDKVINGMGLVGR